MSKTYNYTVQPSQNLIDIAMQIYGTAEALLDICLDNNLDVDDSITPGQELIIDKDKMIFPKLVEYYASKDLILASD